MSNPFRYLKYHREEKEREVQRQLEAEKRTKEQAQQRWNQKIASAEGFDGMVRGVLNRLQEAFYPEYIVRFGPPLYEPCICWSIGEESWDDYKVSWIGKVGVELIFDDRNRPTGFLCGRSGVWRKKYRNTRFWQKKGSYGWDRVLVKFPSVKCDLSEKALINALIKLHPPESLGIED
ncbi:hypothetical protein [Candidatus Promineifilum breve]|uniref:hypothetical protein n=1 Tax=Candidatus Promineifilum breve TaxID=1806508 RepID=UPI0012FFBEF1|nr:hypothetical protein [Candidatus Promineifilum breve]